MMLSPFANSSSFIKNIFPENSFDEIIAPTPLSTSTVPPTFSQPVKTEVGSDPEIV